MLSIYEQAQEKIGKSKIGSTLKRSYMQWIEAYINYHDGRHPILMGSNELKSFIIYLDYKLHLPEKTISSAIEALRFLYTKVLDTTMPEYIEPHKVA